MSLFNQRKIKVYSDTGVKTNMQEVRCAAVKIVLQNRPNYRRSIAGDSIQLIKTEEYLIKTGVNATIDNSPQADLAAYDVVHLFNLIPVVETYQFYLNARQQNKKIVLSTIYWDPVEFFEVVSSTGKFW